MYIASYIASYVHCKEDCKTYLDKRRFEDRHCESRHRRHCRYYDNISGCYRGDHSRKRKEERDYLDKRSELHEEFNCNGCEFKTSHKGILKKHMKSNHLESSYNKAISLFIYRLNLDEFAR